MLADTVIGEGTHDESLQKSGNDAPETISATVADVVFRFRESSENSRYNREQFHAAGGLGEVYKASDRQLNRTVALKQMKPEHVNHEVGRARFVLEAVVTGNLEHPGIVPVYGLGEYSDGRPFYAMRFIEGQSLREAIDQFHGKQSADHNAVHLRKAGFDSLEFRQLLGRFVDVCQAVSYAHSRGVLHRDLKPGNVMLGKFGETLVVDWGLAKVKGKADPEKQISENAADSNSGEDAGFTIDGRPYGTPAYMSPEQARGEVRQLGAETDVYSLGATLYHLLNGVTPHAGVPFSEILQQVQSKTLRPPAPVISGIPQQLTAICQKAMSFDPANRYSNSKDLGEDIERYLADEAVGALRETFIVKSLRWMRKNLVLVVASSAAALLLATIGVAYQSYRLQKSENDLLANRVLLPKEKLSVRTPKDSWQKPT